MEDMKRDHEQDQQASSKEAWQEVGQQFQKLGESLAQAFRTAWNDEDNRRQAQEMRAGVEAMISEVGQAIRDTASSPEGIQARSAMEKTADQLVDAGEKTVQEVRPHLMNALRQVNAELQNFIARMEGEKPSAADEDTSGPTPGTA